MAMPALSGPRSVNETSISESMAPSWGSSALSFRNNPTMPHIGFQLLQLPASVLAVLQNHFNYREFFFHARKQNGGLRSVVRRGSVQVEQEAFWRARDL